MAALVTPPALTVDEYLSMSFEHDMEFIDGELKQKPMPGLLHARVQALLGIWFRQYEEEVGIVSASQPRTRVALNRVRLPDFILVRAGRLPKKALRAAPLLAIEILSEDDKHKDLIARARDLQAMGCGAVWLLDPEERTLKAWSGQEWTSLAEERPMTPAGVPLDLPWLWEELAQSFDMDGDD